MKSAAASLAVLMAATPALAAPPVFSPDRITGHVRVLASDEFEGRAPASAGETKTVGYLIEQFKALGLQPAGDGVGGSRSWTQAVPLMRFEIAGPMEMTAQVGSQVLQWRQGEEVAIRASAGGLTHVALADLPLVFVGYGVFAPERGWDDFKGVDLKGKVALVLVNDPDFETGAGDFGGKAMTYYGRWRYKFEEAARRGAAGVLVVHETAPAAYGWATVKNSNTNAVFDIERADPGSAHAALEGWIQREVAIDLLARSGLDFAALKKQAQTREFRPVMLTGAKLSAHFAVEARRVVTHNVVGVLVGNRRPDEHVALSAHWDHLGAGQPDARGDRIYNGAVDNASGVAVLIELARVFAGAPRTPRSVLFVALTAEEKGLLGSEYYATHPLFSLATTVADINFDALRPTSPSRDFSTAGDPAISLREDLIAAGRALGRRYSPDSHPEAGEFYRSDHFSFAKAGVPAVSVSSGEDLIDGGIESGRAWDASYLANRYHQPADEIDAAWRSDGLAADAALIYRVARHLAESKAWPAWSDGAEFKAERDKSAALRAKPSGR